MSSPASGPHASRAASAVIETVRPSAPPPRASYAAVHVDDLAAAYLAALERGRAGAIYNVLGAAYPTREVAEAVSHAVGADGRTVSITADAAREAWGPLARLPVAFPPVMAVRAALELEWTPRAPSLLSELVHGTLRRTLGA